LSGLRSVVQRGNNQKGGVMLDDDEDYPPEGGCLGVGAAFVISERAVRRPKKEPIGFVHFLDPPQLKSRRVKIKAKLKSRRRKR